MTNDADRNEGISFPRASDGSLQAGKRFSTGGRGTGGVTDPLDSQGSLTLSLDHSLLFAVNPGSSEISVFTVEGSRLSLADKVTFRWQRTECNRAAWRPGLCRQRRRQLRRGGIPPDPRVDIFTGSPIPFDF